MMKELLESQLIRQKEEEEHKLKIEKEKAIRKNLTQEEKDLELFIKAPDDPRSYTLCKAFDSEISSELKKRIAEALRDFWKKTERWKKSQGKQKDRVKLVKEFLPQE